MSKPFLARCNSRQTRWFCARFPDVSRSGIPQILAAILALGFFTGLGFTQNTFGPSVQGPLSDDDENLYILLRNVSRDDKRATELEAQGKRGDSARNLNQRVLRFTDDQFAPIRNSAQRLDSETKEVERKMQVFWNAARAAQPSGGEPPASVASSPEYIALVHERQELIAREISNLKNALGLELTKQVSTHLRNTTKTVIVKNTTEAPQ